MGSANARVRAGDVICVAFGRRRRQCVLAVIVVAVVEVVVVVISAIQANIARLNSI